MANETVSVWGGQTRFGRKPASGELLVGDSAGNFQLTTASTEVQALLDSISTTQRAMLYRGASAWQAIVPVAFRAYLSTTQSGLSSGTTIVNLDTIEFQTTSSGFNTSTHKFTPTVAGYYQIAASVWGGWTSTGQNSCRIHKNNEAISNALGSYTFVSATGSLLTALVYLNGSTDYIDLRSEISGTSPFFYAGINSTYLSAAWVGPP